LQHAGVGELVLDVGADDAGGVLGAQSKALRPVAVGSGTIFPGVHLLGDDVGLFPYAARKERGVLEDRRANLTKAVACKDRSCGRLHIVP
jgi:hypothetical protein